MTRLFACVLLCFSAFAPASAATVLVMGDSLSAGYGIGQQQAWPSLLAARLARQDPGMQVANASISGETTAGARSRMEQTLRQHHPSVVILALGSNDGLRGLPLEQMRANLLAMITASRATGARVLLLGMRLPPNYGPDYTRRFEQTFAELARAHKTPFVPFMLEGFGTERSLFLDDGIHPTAAAQPRILDNIWPALRPLLGR
ncbi:MAG: arylesterase [Betaproteobacteria bacterium]|nr:arylesterase [Betaproteobacteria bacterium]